MSSSSTNAADIKGGGKAVVRAGISSVSVVIVRFVGAGVAGVGRNSRNT